MAKFVQSSTLLFRAIATFVVAEYFLGKSIGFPFEPFVMFIPILAAGLLILFTFDMWATTCLSTTGLALYALSRLVGNELGARAQMIIGAIGVLLWFFGILVSAVLASPWWNSKSEVKAKKPPPKPVPKTAQLKTGWNTPT